MPLLLRLTNQSVQSGILAARRLRLLPIPQRLGIGHLVGCIRLTRFGAIQQMTKKLSVGPGWLGIEPEGMRMKDACTLILPVKTQTVMH
jgi:hypothetical protein